MASVCPVVLHAAEEKVETIIVTGHKSQRTSFSDIDLEQYTGFAKVIERDAFADRLSSVAELLKNLPSVQVKQTGGLGSSSEIALRGSKGKQVNLFFDGLLMNNPFQGTASLQSIPTVLIERIEVYPDFTPLNLSNANLAGAVNFHSRDLKNQESGGQMSIAYGSFSTRQVELSGWGDAAGWQLIGGFNFQAADNDYPVPDDLFREDASKRQNDAYWDRGGFAKVAKNFGSASLQLLLQSDKNHKELSTILNRRRDAAFIENETQRLQGIVDYHGDSWQASHRFFYAAEQALFNDEKATIGLGTEKNKSKQQAFGLFNMASVLLAKHELIASINLEINTFKQRDLLKKQALLDGDRNTVIIGLADNWYITEKFMLNATARQLWLEESIEYLQEAKPAVKESNQHSSAQIGFNYAALKALTIKGNLGRSIRVPYIFEKYGNLGAFKGNPDLQVEQADMVDLGFVVDLGAYRLSSSVFHKDIKNGIYTIFDSRGVGHPLNIGFSTITGIEGELFMQPADFIELGANFSLLDTKNNSYIKSHKGRHMPGIYHENYGASITFLHRFFRYSNSLQHYNHLFYDPANSVKADQQLLWHSSLSFYLKQFVFDITGRNLTNKNYMDYNRMPTPGRSLIATLTLNFWERELWKRLNTSVLPSSLCS